MHENYNIAIDTHIGGRTDNQDFAAKLETPIGDLILVCDGVGGGNGGGVASETAANVILNEFSDLSGQEDPIIVLNRAITNANRLVHTRSIQERDLRGMATTVVALLINPQYAVIAHVGDSRAHQVRGNKIIFHTRDHSKVQELIDEGHLTKEEAREHRESHQITRAIGAKPTVQIDVQLRPYKKGDIFILTTDGIHDAIDQKEFLKAIKKQKIPQAIAGQLVEISHKNGLQNQNGMHDNMTLAIIEMKINSQKFAYKNHFDKRFLPVIYLLSGALITALLIYILANIFVNNGQAEDYPDEQMVSALCKQNVRLIKKTDSLLNANTPGSMDYKTIDNIRSELKKTFENSIQVQDGLCPDDLDSACNCPAIRDSIKANRFINISQTFALKAKTLEKFEIKE